MLNLRSHHPDSPPSRAPPAGSSAASQAVPGGGTLSDAGWIANDGSRTNDGGGPLERRQSYDIGRFRDPLTKLSHMYRLLKLVQEFEPEGAVEKIVIDQDSLGHLLNKLLPGSYESISKINLTALDKLNIKPLGLYGIEPEIINFLKGVKCLSDKDAMFLASSTSLGSGLYLALAPQNAAQDPDTHAAYIVYWPEPTTWRDDAVSSVRHNRVMFMRYLSKLTSQTIALVSAQQAKAIVCPGDVDSPENDSTEREFNFTVDEIEEEEDFTIYPGPTFNITPHDIPRINEASGIDLVAGEEHAGLMVSWREPDQCSLEQFEETWSQEFLRSQIKSTTRTLIPGALPADQLLILGANGLREMYPQPFLEYDRRMEVETRKWAQGWKAAAQSVDDEIEQDEPRLEAFITRAIRNIYHETFPSIEAAPSEEIDVDSDALLREQYPDLEDLADKLKGKHDFSTINDPTFEDLKQTWCITHRFLEHDPQPSEGRQQDFMRKVLDNNSNQRGGRTRYNLKSGARKAWQEFMEVTGVTNPGILEQSRGIKDPDFMVSLQALLNRYPIVLELRDRIISAFQSYQASTEAKLLDEYIGSIMSKEQSRRLTIQKELQDDRLRSESAVSLSLLHEQLKSRMPQDTQNAARIDSIKPAESEAINSYHVRGQLIERLGPWNTRVRIYPLILSKDGTRKSDEPRIFTPKLGLSLHFEFTLRGGHTIK
ncbi:hypothetical protein FS749_010308 [Ceratobasidium sp. UAMH 11750]|nr:hypothetical protein FS749_010308 [Ceratobasidium sp. UAMH 11750]